MYDINFNSFKGVYDPGRYKWSRTEESNDVIFRFTGPTGETCEARLSASGSASNFEFSYDDDDYYYSEEYVFRFSIPRNLTFTLTQGRGTLANAKVETRIDYDGHNYSASVDATAANISVKVNTEGNDSKITENSTVAVNGQVLVGTAAELTGKNLCNVDRIVNNLPDDLDEGFLTRWFTSAQAKVNVMDKVQAYADVKFNNSFCDIDETWGYWDYNTREQARAEAERVADVFNKNIDAKIRYNNTKTDQALIRFEPQLDEWSYYGWEYIVEPVLYFPQDETSYRFNDYFKSGFRSLTNQWNNLVKSYQRLWK